MQVHITPRAYRQRKRCPNCKLDYSQNQLTCAVCGTMLIGDAEVPLPEQSTLRRYAGVFVRVVACLWMGLVGAAVALCAVALYFHFAHRGRIPPSPMYRALETYAWLGGAVVALTIQRSVNRLPGAIGCAIVAATTLVTFVLVVYTVVTTFTIW